MSYKTILVHVDDSRSAAKRVELAGRIALAENAHLIGASMTGVSRFFYESMAMTPGDPSLSPYLDTLRERAENALASFESIVQRMGISSYEKRLVDDDAANGFSIHARYSDLVVLGQYDRDDPQSTVTFDLPEYVAMNGGSPVLVVPYAGQFNRISERVLIAWNGSAESKHAMQGALPLMKRAKTVEVAIFERPRKPDVNILEFSDAAVAAYLDRHGIKANVTRHVSSESGAGGDIGTDLLSLAADLSSDLLVMGCYGHSRFREIMLGGASRTILQSMTVPVLMAH